MENSSLLRSIRNNPVLSKLDIHYHWGCLKKPVFILVHGHGVSKRSWICPLNMTVGNSPRDPLAFIRINTQEVHDDREVQKTLPPGNFFFSTIQRPEKKNEIRSFWQILSQAGYSLITWNQRYPNGPLNYAIEEMEQIYQLVASQPFTRDIIFLCHSRGGLVVRSFFQSHPPLLEKTRALIMLGTPNRGSMLATFAKKFARFRKFPRFLLFARRFFPAFLQKSQAIESLLAYINRWIDFLNSEAVSELKVNSPLVLTLKGKEAEEQKLAIPYYHFVGTRSQYDKIYFSPKGEDHLIEIPLAYNSLPNILLPWELVDGKGDGLVAVYRAKLGFEVRFVERKVNHTELLIDKEIQNQVLEIAREV